jgi:hypothetical protein
MKADMTLDPNPQTCLFFSIIQLTIYVGVHSFGMSGSTQVESLIPFPGGYV